MRSLENCFYKMAKKTNTKVSLDQCLQIMPYEILVEVFRRLPKGKLIGLSEMCSKFRNTCFWEYSYIRFWYRSNSDVTYQIFAFQELYSEPWPVKVIDISLTQFPRKSDSLSSDRIENIINYSLSGKVLGLNGLKNIGNTCFMNTIIQCLSNTKPILEYLLKNTYVRDIKKATFSVDKALILAFANVTSKLWSENATDNGVDTMFLKGQVQKLAPCFIGDDQHDAHEFLRYLIQGLHEDVNRVTEKPEPIHMEIDEELSDSEKSDESWARYLRTDNSEIAEQFVGQLKSTLECWKCGHRAVTFDPFWDLSLPIPQRKDQVSLSHCLESFTEEDVLYGDEGPTCPKCKKRKICSKTLTIQKLPKILVIHLKRFSSNEWFAEKLDVAVDFPLEGLDMSPYVADNVTPCKYNLYAISNHSGSVSGGHYMAYCRHPYAKTWHEYNDSHVSSISPESVITEDAYVLFYELEEPRKRDSLSSNRIDKIINYSLAGKVLGLNGLKNIGNTCFMNSVIQCLSNTKVILEYLLKNSYVRDIKKASFSVDKALILAFAGVTSKLWSEDVTDHVVNTMLLKNQVQKLAPCFIGNDQQDAHEFLRYLIQGLHEDVNKVTEKPEPIHTDIDEELSDSEKSDESWARYLRTDNSEIVEHFVGQLKSTLECCECGHRVVTFDPFWDLSLPIPQREDQVRLSHCLESFTEEEVLYGDEKPTCPKCEKRRICIKSLTIQKLPKILVIHLKRFSSNEWFTRKLDVAVDFPLEGLDMSPYAADNVTPCKYNLYAISNHSGSPSSGHYMAYCRHPYAKTWHEYNDSHVWSISPESVVTEDAYVLFYELEE